MEFADKGAHCSELSCGQLDFLPLRCAYCARNYCAAHLHQHGTCPGRPASTTTAAPVVRFDCSVELCANSESVRIICSLCTRTICLKHRLPEDHACHSAIPSGLSISAKKSRLTGAERIALARQKLGHGSKTNAVKTKSLGNHNNRASGSSVTKAQRLRLKFKARGEERVPKEFRRFFMINFEANIARNSDDGDNNGIAIWLDARRSIGHALDYLCRTYSALNLNNDNSAARLTIFRGTREDKHTDEVFELPFEHKIDDLINQKAIEEFDTLVIGYSK